MNPPKPIPQFSGPPWNPGPPHRLFTVLTECPAAARRPEVPPLLAAHTNQALNAARPRPTHPAAPASPLRIHPQSTTTTANPPIPANLTDPAVFGPLYRRHYPAIAGYLFRRTGDAHAAEDLAAETFLAAMRGIAGFKGTDDAAFRRWLFVIATNAANRWARRRARLRITADAAARTKPCEAPAAHDTAAEREEAQAALLALPAEHQAVLSLHYLEGLPLEEVAAVIGRPAGTIKSRLFRARRALAKELERRQHLQRRSDRRA
jgi:RNA polymerase sigma-70 factor (ECF subfamily)